MKYWLVKQEPEAYSFSDLIRDGKTEWTGVRNYQARNHLRSMKKGDTLFFYHSVSEKQIVGLAQVSREAYPDSTATEGDWSCVEVRPIRAFKTLVTLEMVKKHSTLCEIPLIRQSRLSVMPIATRDAQSILKLAGEKG